MRKALSLFALMILLLPLNGCFGAEGQKALDEALTIEKCNSITYLSSSQTTRIFRKYYGMAPYEYLTSRRMQLAQELLRTSSYSIRDIAIQLGFQDQNYFSKYFKMKCGKSPKEFRDASGSVPTGI